LPWIAKGRRYVSLTTMAEDSFIDDGGISYEIPNDEVAGLKSPQVQRVGNTFCDNADIVTRLLALPLTLLTIGESNRNRFLFLAEQLIVQHGRLKASGFSKEAYSEVDNEAERRYEEVTAQDPNFDAVKSAKAMLRKMATCEDLRRPVQALLYTSAVYIWSALECALKDAWIEAVNLLPFPFGHRSLLRVPKESTVEGISSKQVSVGLLAKHGFDVRDKLGTILAEKYDFTGTEGIRVAYAAAFGKEQSIESVLSSIPLRRLEAIRHLIAHRAGLVDREFVRRTGETHPIGGPLPVDMKTLCELFNVASSTAITVLTFVDDKIASGGAAEVSGDTQAICSAENNNAKS